MNQAKARQDTPWHALASEKVLAALDARLDGLTIDEAAERLARFGPNSIEEAPPPGPLSKLVKQLASPLILMLLGAAAISLLASHTVDAVVIGTVVTLNVVIGVVQEWRAETALEALRQLSAPTARVLRNGDIWTVETSQIVPGDVLVLETGDRIPADARLTEAAELTIDESTLTGESEPVRKSVADIAEETPLPDRLNMAWASTVVTGGRGQAIVVRTGMQTVIGEIAGQVQGTERQATPLQQRIARLGTHLGLIALGAAGGIFVFGLLRGFSLVEMLLFAVAAAVSAIPEGLPAVISIVLAVGVQRMSRRNAIVRRLPAVETLGSTTVVCSDKTGTITRNQMTVRRMWTAAGSYDVEGDGFEPEGRILDDGGVPVEAGALEDGLRLLLEIGALANNAVLQRKDGNWTIQGNPTDGALLVVARKAGMHAEGLERQHERLDEITFSSQRKYMATLNRAGDGAMLFVKGAPERLLSASTHVRVGTDVHPIDESLRSRIRSANDEFADDALRVVAGAYRDLSPDGSGVGHDAAESGLVFVGLWGLLDPPREEAAAAVASAQRAGIRVVMITGDHAATASAIARKVGIAAHGERTVTGEELDSLTDDDLRSQVEDIAVYARVAPEHKLRIVQALRSRGHIVAMTGDGVNDAPALKSADIGVAMGLSGTEVAKEAADMVLADDNFATIINAVEEGRVIFSNLRRVVGFLLTTTSAEVLTLFAALALGFHLPVTAVMILWINLVTDGITTIPLGLEPKHADVLMQPPRAPTEGVLSRQAVLRIAVLAGLTAVGTLSLFAWESQTKDLAHAQTIAFTTLVAFEWFKALTWRTSDQSLLSVGPLSNRWIALALAVAIPLQLAAVHTRLGHIAFGTVPLTMGEWARTLVMASTILIADETGKFIRRAHRSMRAATP